jgi:hypothetical protein
MPRKPPDPQIVELALSLVRDDGLSFADAGKAVSVSEGCVRNWCKQAGVKSHCALGLPASTPLPVLPLPVLPAHMRPADDVPLDDIDASDVAALAERMIKDVRQLAHDMRGNPRAATQLASALEKLVRLRHQIERGAREAGDGIHVTPLDFAAASADLDAKLLALAERGKGIRCCDCNRELSISFGLGESDPDKKKPGGGTGGAAPATAAP